MIINAETATFVVHGQVRWGDGKPFANAAIQVVDRDVRGEQVLGKTTTDKEGNYRLPYSRDKFTRAEKESADLMVRVLHRETGAVFASSDVLFNAPLEATINLTVHQATAGLLSEYERLIAEIGPLLVNVNVAGVDKPTMIDRLADLKTDDLNFLARETQIALNKLIGLTASAILQKKSKEQRCEVPAAIFYGMAREGLPTNIAALGLITEKRKLMALADAFTANLIPSSLKSQLPAILSLLQKLTVQQTLTAPSTTGQPALTELLGTTLKNPDTQAAFLTAYVNHGDQPIELFWASMRENPAFSQHVDALQFTLQLGVLTQNNVPLIQALTQDFNNTGELIRLGTEEWKDLVNKTGLPPGLPGDTAADKTIAYVDSVRSVLHAAYPHETAVHILSSAPDINLDEAMRKSVSQFFANSPDFNLRTTRITGYIADNPDTAFKNITEADRPAVVAHVKRSQRLLQVSTDADAFTMLLGTKYDSAHAIVKKSKKHFIEENSNALGGREKAEVLYQRAESITSQALQTYALLNDAINGMHPYALNGTPGPQPAVQALLVGDNTNPQQYPSPQQHPYTDIVAKYIPNYADLFGMQDFCECAECRSVLSPAAYLVDLLHFLELSGKNEAGFSPYDVLVGKGTEKGRRPDLAHLKLTCENTNTTLPYVDLVNEVLESYVALGYADKSAAHDTASTTAQELDANPQNTLEAAYIELDKAVYPCTLPFNQPIASIRAYLDNLGITRHELLSTFDKAQSVLSQTAINAEYLKIDAKEFVILTGKDFGSAAAPALQNFSYYGVANLNAMLALTNHIPDLLHRTGVTYNDLIELVKTRFFNPSYPSGDALSYFQKIPVSFATLTALKNANFQGPVVTAAILNSLYQAGTTIGALKAWTTANYATLSKLIVLEAPDDNQYDLRATKLQHLDGTPLTDAQFGKLHRFFRLWRKMDWSIVDLDRALTALNALDITPMVINQLAQIKQLQSELKLPKLQVLLSMWAPINISGPDALYAKLFLNKAALAIDDQFAPEQKDGPVLTAPGLFIKDHIPGLLGALRITAADLDAIRADAGLTDTPQPAPLTLNNVSKLHRYAALAKAMKLGIAELISLKTLTGIDPFGLVPVTQVFLLPAFIAAVRKIKKSDFKVATLDYLYRHLELPPAKLAPLPSTVTALAKSLRDGLNAIAQDNLAAPDPVGTLVRAKLGVLFESSVVDQAITMINGTALYTAKLATLPAAVATLNQANDVTGIDASKLGISANKTRYDPAAKLLSFKGAMTDPEKTALLAASPDAQYQQAVNSLFDQPAAFVVNTLSGFLVPATAITDLLRTTPSLDQDLQPVVLSTVSPLFTPTPEEATTTAVAAKFAYMLNALLPYLRNQLSHAFATQVIADALKLDGARTNLLLEKIVKSQDEVQPASADLLAAMTFGLSARYFTSADLTTGSLTVDAVAGTAISAGTQSARWTGRLLAPNTGDFTLAVHATGKVKLWIDDSVKIGTDQAGVDASGEQTAIVPLKAGELYKLVLEVDHILAPGIVELRWQSATTPKALIPADNFYPSVLLDTLSLTYTRLQKAAILINAFRLDAREMAWLTDPVNAAGFGGFNLNDLPLVRNSANDPAAQQTFASWLRVNDFVTLRNSLPQSESSLIDVFQANTMGDAKQALAQLTGWDSKAIDVLTAPVTGFNMTAADFKTDVALQRLQQGMALAGRLGVSPDKLFAWAELPDFANMNAFFTASTNNKKEIQKAIHAQYDEETWLTVAKPINDSLRQLQRDALVAYLLPLLGKKDSNELFEYFLIDVDMCACMDTSRVKQALSSVQLFVQRCLLNLEARDDIPARSVLPSAIDAQRWEWMKHYRVWEANRKIFLYPENWLVPELRTDKSPFFQELESELLQSEVTADTVETSFMNYLQKLDQVARLEIVGTYWQDKEGSSDTKVMHVFGRTYGTPHTYFHRTWINSSKWTAWEKVPLDIEGDHLVPIVWNRRLHLIWPTFLQKIVPYVPATIDGGTKNTVKEPQHYWEIKLCWSEFKDGKWQPKRITSDFLESNSMNVATSPTDRFAPLQKHMFRAYMTADGNLSVNVYAQIDKYTDYRNFVGRFLFDTSGVISIGYRAGKYKITPLNPPLHRIENMTTGWEHPAQLANDDADSGWEFNMWKGAGDQTTRKLGLSFDLAASDSVTVFLDRAPSPYRLVLPHQFVPINPAGYTPMKINGTYQFFFQDAQRTYFALPALRKDDPPKAVAKPDINIILVDMFPQLDPGGPVYQWRGEEIDPLGGIEVGGIDLGGIATGGIKVGGHGIDAGFGLPTAMARKSGPIANLQDDDKDPEDQGQGPAEPPDEGKEPPKTPDATTKPPAVPEKTYSWDYSSPFKNGASNQLQFFTHYHPHVTAFVKSLNRDGVSGLLTVDNQKLKTDTTFGDRYRPNQNGSKNVVMPYPKGDVDFEPDGAYSLYNWELFFHAPLLIGTRLTKNQRFAEAKKWFEYIFNPTADTEGGEAAPARFWNVVKLKTTNKESLDKMLWLLSTKDADLSAAELKEKQSLKQQYDDLNEHPFQPHLIANLRLSAYQKYVVMAYIDNLIAWGDQLFRQDTIEAINEATQLYVMAGNLLGERPQKLPSRGKVQPKTYADIKSQLNNSNFVDPIVEIEDAFPFATGPGVGSGATGGLMGVGHVPYFCIPQNDKLLGYWDTVADRLFKIRNCMNIEGVVRELALFEPPIDPMLLVQATAHGVNLNTMLGDLNTPLPYYRYSYMQQKALEICSEVRALGSALLSALEKKDTEEIALLRSTHEINILNMMEEVKKSQVAEASGQIDALMKSRSLAGMRYVYYQTLLGADGASLPGIDSEIALLPHPYKNAADPEAGLPLTEEEQNELAASMSAHDWTTAAGYAEGVGAIVSYVPDTEAAAKFMGLGAGVKFGGSQLSAAAAAAAKVLHSQAAGKTYDSSHSGRLAVHQRRAQEWTQQSNLAAGEIMQIDKQLAAANIRRAIAERDLTVHQQQVQNAQDVQDLMNSKFTNKDLYAWTISDISATYFQCYQMAYDLAKKAERAFRFECGITSSNYIQFGYWDSLRKGLQSGERLALALKQMERAYHDQNKREYEITKHVSLQLNDPLALITLKKTGKCEFALPESMFDADFPGHYMRRIKSVSMTLPCVTGPYTGINCTLTLLNNKTRINSQNASAYLEDIENGDNRFIANFAAMQSIAISHAQNDSGMFELNFRDERYLPFEGAGAVSRWRIDLPKETNAFDLETLTDVVMHLKYTARDGGDILKKAAKTAMENAAKDADSAPLMRMFSARHEFPVEWYRFLHPANQGALDQTLTLDLSKERFPYLFRGRNLVATRIDVLFSFKDNAKFGAATELAFSLTAQEFNAGETKWTSTPNVFNGTPYKLVVGDMGLPNTLSLKVAASALDNLPPGQNGPKDVLTEQVPPVTGVRRIKAGEVEDMVLVVHYYIDEA